MVMSHHLTVIYRVLNIVHSKKAQEFCLSGWERHVKNVMSDALNIYLSFSLALWTCNYVGQGINVPKMQVYVKLETSIGPDFH